MAEYNINFSTNASQIAKELSKVQTELAKAVQMAKPGGLEIKLSLNTSQLEASINTTFRKLNKEIESNQRKLSRLQIGGGNFDLIAGRLGRAEGQKERGQLLAAPSRLRGQAEAFEFGSEIRSKKILESLRIQASQIAPNTVEWTTFQQLIGQVTLELKQADRAAESIQLTQQLGALAPGSLSRLDKQLTILKNRAREIAPNTIEWKKLNKEIQNVETSIAKVNKKPMTMGQRAGAAGGAFLYGGGLGGGAGSALGGIAGGLAGGVPGAFTGAAVGQAVDNLTAMAGAMAEQAAAVRRLQSGLASASTSLQDYALASQEVDRISNRLLIPIDEATRKFTQLRASTVALGIDTKTTGELFEGTAAAVLRSGGSMDDVSGAMRAVVQVFSKGKLTAEELRGQLAERLPGAVVDFARISGKSLQQIDQEFEAGEATLDDFVKFLKSKKDDTSNYVDEMATSSEFAGARMNKAFESLRINIGNALQPTGAVIQDFATNSIRALDALIRKAIESKLIQPGPDFLESEALAGKQGGVAGLEERLLKASELEGKLRKTADSMGLGFLIDFSKPLQTAAKEAKNLEEALVSIRKKEDLTKKAAKQLQDEEKKAKKDQTAAGFLGAIEKREESLAQAREQYEEEIAEARRDATKRAEELERKYKDNRITAEREIDRVRRELQAATAEEGFLRRGLNAPATGERQSIIEAEREAASIVREYTEDKISREQEAQDREIQIARDLENFKKVNADAINKAGERYAKKVGEIQQAYARTVAKLIEDGSGNGAKKLAAAGKAIAAMIAKASAQQAFTAAAGTPIIPRGRGTYDIAGETYTEADISEIIAAQRKKTDPIQKAIGSALEAYVAADKEATASAKDLGVKLGLTATSKTPSIGSVSTADLDARVQSSASSLSAINAETDDANNKLSKQETIVNGLLGLFAQQAQASTQQTEELDKQLQQNLTQIDLIKNGTLPGLAQQQVQSESLYDLQRKQLSASEKGALGAAATIADVKDRATVEAAILKLHRDQLVAINENEKAYENFLGIARSAEAALEAEKIRANGQLIGGGMKAGFIGEAARAYEGAIEKGFNKEESSEIARATQEVKYLTLASEGLEGAISNVGDSFGNAFKGIITGSMTAQEALAGMFQSIADSFADMVAQMIAEWLKAQLIEGIMNIVSMFSPGFGTGIAPGPVAKSAGVKFSPTKMGPAFANGGIAPGGFTAFANGGMVTGPTMGLVGEGRYNEAIVPLPDGKSIPVDLGGATGSQITSNIVVNVSSDGKTSSSGAGSDSAGLGRKLEGAVKQVIVDELRPGGLLAGRR
jgi:tape measure domain-containing protein